MRYINPRLTLTPTVFAIATGTRRQVKKTPPLTELQIPATVTTLTYC